MPVTLVVIQGRRSGEVYSFGADLPVLLGSSPQAHVRLPDRGIAGIHARLSPIGIGWEILAAPGLTLLVNGVVTARSPIVAGDRIELGEAGLGVSTCARAGAAPSPQGAAPQPASPAPSPSNRPTAPLNAKHGASAAGEAPGAVHFLNGPSKGRVVPLVGATITLGRAPTADVPLLDARCSRIHARIERVRGNAGYMLLDMGSTNGSRLNGTQLPPGTARPLSSGDWIQLGSTVLEFHVGIEAARMGDTNHEPDDLPIMPPSATPSPEEARFSRQAPTDKMPTRSERQLEADPILQGDLRRMQFADVVQFLSMARKSGDLTIDHPSGRWRLSFHEGNAVHATGPQPWPPMQAFQAMARLDQGRFEFVEGSKTEEPTLKISTQALLLEALRLVDEQTDIQGILQ